MATLVGCICASHVPAMHAAPNGNDAANAERGNWEPYLAGFAQAQAWLERAQADTAVVLYNDHGFNFFLDNMPTFAVGTADGYDDDADGVGVPPPQRFAGHAPLSWHCIESLVRESFDVASCQRMLLDPALTLPMQWLWTQKERGPRIVPVNINTVQHPLPSPRRCYLLGQALGRAIGSWDEGLRVAVIATGGLSQPVVTSTVRHEFDRMCLGKLADDPGALLHYSIEDLVQTVGIRGVEIISWIAGRGTLSGQVRTVFSSYHSPGTQSAAGLLVLEAATA